ncbi:hypothetical protein Bpfe_025614 [Biomphalaria pfeifferi]|uniref:Uncharacterized protein n=1 Tax=Biomphalaria pfeifferi TaxID=112525 RepID=A0AAD8EZX5_BIOPF|nr:hypothetical protein Bpfe_025614 [Biomphalaria pfeifferi]
MGRTRLEEVQGRSDVQKGQGSVLTETFLITRYGAGFWFTGSRRTGQTQCQVSNKTALRRSLSPPESCVVVFNVIP